ncbi:cation-translocating P-type ATPase [Caldibacillus sp. 210928-DFI.2.22]|uniref:heavy metal translocating P-type ATPase n=1 Tax=unclassified Caldibacillus TaxID=2641266 RepID=UPI001D08DE4E|nr:MULTISPECIES: cation-translocating P-type ATPase [unclassified Caldibacillus]MCB7070603.1 cation-translocating P-type ATPase [Caldibacillus sp. 210928-DFI.2.22]MCB7074127.1 cation-translocating P-type ATPase [Caldibacillus sp. 210928-DFI.2.18]
MTAKINQHKNQITWISGTLIIAAILSKLFHLSGLSNSFLIIATVIAIVPIAIKAWQAMIMRTFSIELLVFIAVIGAVFIQEYTESAVVTFLFLLGDYLEARTLEKTRSSLKELVDMAPQEAILLHADGSREEIDIDLVEEGNRLVVLPGGKIPVDGRIVKGHALINEAAITGESIPANKAENDRVYSGSILDNGYIEIIAEKVGEDTTFAKIIELVEEAQESRSSAERFLDRFANYYTPAVVILSLFVFAFTRDLHLAITFLVIACPGALVIGAPVSAVAGIGNGAKNGVLIKGGDIMEKFAKVDTLVFDKTGTLTKGKPTVTDFHNLSSMPSRKLLALIAKAETISEHHLGQTIVKEAEKNGIDLSRFQITESEAIKGNGITATVDGYSIVAGNRKLMNGKGIKINSEASLYAIEREKAGNTAIFVGINGELAAIISIADQVRDDAKAALADMRANGVKRIIMLTGDNRHTAEAVANELGMDEFHAELLPNEKVEYVKKLKEQGAIVAMAGDGINDAPAIATADIGLAMGEGGTDVSMETADVVLMADKLSQYAHAFALSKATIRNMRQNIFIALAVVVILLLGVLADQVHLAGGMFIHEGSVLVVILNAMRLIGFKTKIASEAGKTDGRQREKLVA